MTSRTRKALIIGSLLSIFVLGASANPAWSEAPLQGNDGLSNLLMLYDQMEDNEGLNNDQISTFLTLYNCREDGVESIGSCMSQVSSEINHPQEYISVSDLPHNNVDLTEENNQDEDDSENTEEEEPLVSNYLYLEEASVIPDEVGKKNDLTLNIDITKNDVKDIGSQPTISLLKNGVQRAEKQVYWSQDSVSFDWDNVWTGSEQNDVSFAVIMERKNTGDYRWNRQTAEAGEADIVRCGPGHVYSSFHDSHSNTEYDGCISENEQVVSDSESVEEDTGWRLKTENSLIHTLESIEGEETSSGESLSIDTGDVGYCGRVYFQNTYTGSNGEISTDIEMVTKGNPDRLGWHQEPQKFFMEVDGEIVKTLDLDNGESSSFEESLESGSVVRVGIDGEPSEPLFGCNQYHQRTKVNIDIGGEFNGGTNTGN
jgi:hypothetical protein